MITSKSLLSVVVFASFLALKSAYCDDRSNLIVGILPTFDAGDKDVGPLFKQHLPLRLYRQLEKRGIRVALLNPGRLYRPEDEEWLTDYGKQSGAELLLITSLLPTQFPQHGDAVLTVKCEVLDLNSGARSTAWEDSVKINRRDVMIDYRRFIGFGGITLAGPDTPFEKLPLGKAMIEIADQIEPQLLDKIKIAIATKLAGASPIEKIASNQESGTIGHSSGGCDILMKILYASKGSASKSFDIFVDGRDESLGLNEGVLRMHNKSGPVLLQWAMHDIPYRLPVQDFYQATSYVNCAKPERQLTVKIGGTGEALLTWQ